MECMIATSSQDAAASLIFAKPFVSQERRNSQPSSDLMTSFMADGELENTHNLELMEWQIPGFSGEFSFPNSSGSKLYQSQSFCFAGAKWHLQMRGWRGDMSLKGIVSVNLFKEASASDCRISYSIGIKNSSGFVEWIRGTDTHCFEASGGKSKIFQFNKKLELLYRKPVLVPAGVLTVVCALKSGAPHRVTSFMVKSKTTQTELEYGVHELSRNLEKLMVSEDKSDVTIKVQDEEFHLHRGILGARMEFFSSMFAHQMKENMMGVVTIDDCEAEVFRTLMEYVYTGWVGQLSGDMVFRLYMLADKYQVEEVMSFCLEFIENTLCVDTFCDVFTLAVVQDNGQLLSMATSYFVLNAAEIMSTKKWIDFIKEYHIQANELLLKVLLK